MNKTVLAVDDSPSMRQIVASTLNSGGFDVREAADGVEAYRVAHETDAALVITDVNMPRMDGITLVSKLRELPNYKYVPILVLTTEASAETKAAGREAGATGWIVKPFDPEQLLNLIKRLIEN